MRTDGAAKRFLPLALATGVMLVGLYIYEPRFLSGGNISNLLRGASLLAVIATGQMLVMIVGGFDLSVGGTAALSSVVTALTMASVGEVLPQDGATVALLGAAAGLFVGLLIGLINGMVIALCDAPPFMVTLGMLSVVSGTAFYLTAGTPVYGMPDEFVTGFARGEVLGVSHLVWASLAIVVTVWLLQDFFAVGRHIRAVGSSRHCARLTGISVRAYTTLVYAISGMLAATVGVLLTARIGSGQSTIGLELMLQSIAIAVVGGVSLRGGVGHVGAIALAALFFSVVTNGMNLVRVNSRMQVVVMGVIIIVATLAERLPRARRSP